MCCFYVVSVVYVECVGISGRLDVVIFFLGSYRYFRLCCFF